MNWLNESRTYALNTPYLDELLTVYPVVNNEKRDISGEFKIAVTELQETVGISDIVYLSRFVKLLKAYRVKKSPINDSYFNMFRKCSYMIYRNPGAATTLSKILKGMSVEEIFEACSAPKEGNRQRGASLQNYLHRQYEGFEEREFLMYSGDEIIRLIPSKSKSKTEDVALADSAKKHFGYTGDKGLDAVLKCGELIFLIEGKFITDDGGNQNNQIKNACSISIDANQKKVIPVGVLDGFIWINDKCYAKLQEMYGDKNLISIFLLDQFIGSGTCK